MVARPGRKPKPTVLEKLEGNPGKRRLPVYGMPIITDTLDMPDWLLPDAKVAWKQLMKWMMDIGLYSATDRAILTALCQTYGRWIQMQSMIKQYSNLPQENPYDLISKQYRKMIVKLCKEFGFSLHDFLEIVGNPEEKASNDPMEQLLTGGWKNGV